MPELRPRHEAIMIEYDLTPEQQFLLEQEGFLEDEEDAIVDELVSSAAEENEAGSSFDSELVPDFFSLDEETPTIPKETEAGPTHLEEEAKECEETPEIRPHLDAVAHFEDGRIMVTHTFADGPPQPYDLTEFLMNEYPNDYERMMEARENGETHFHGPMTRNESIDTENQIGYDLAIWTLNEVGSYDTPLKEVLLDRDFEDHPEELDRVIESMKTGEASIFGLRVRDESLDTESTIGFREIYYILEEDGGYQEVYEVVYEEIDEEEAAILPEASPVLIQQETEEDRLLVPISSEINLSFLTSTPQPAEPTTFLEIPTLDSGFSPDLLEVSPTESEVNRAEIHGEEVLPANESIPREEWAEIPLIHEPVPVQEVAELREPERNLPQGFVQIPEIKETPSTPLVTPHTETEVDKKPTQFLTLNILPEEEWSPHNSDSKVPTGGDGRFLEGPPQATVTNEKNTVSVTHLSPAETLSVTTQLPEASRSVHVPQVQRDEVSSSISEASKTTVTAAPKEATINRPLADTSQQEERGEREVTQLVVAPKELNEISELQIKEAEAVSLEAHLVEEATHTVVEKIASPQEQATNPPTLLKTDVPPEEKNVSAPSHSLTSGKEHSTQTLSQEWQSDFRLPNEEEIDLPSTFESKEGRDAINSTSPVLPDEIVSIAIPTSRKERTKRSVHYAQRRGQP